jgi:transcriptional regulator with XRE-family HTH domain
MKKISDLHKKWMKNPEYRKEFDVLEEEFAVASAMIAARTRAGLTQDELAELMNTKQSTIARLESGRSMPSGKTMKKFAEATGSKLRIAFERTSKGKAA